MTFLDNERDTNEAVRHSPPALVGGDAYIEQLQARLAESEAARADVEELQTRLAASEAARADLAKRVEAMDNGALREPTWRPKRHSDELALERAVMRTETSARRAEESSQDAVERHAATARREAATRQQAEEEAWVQARELPAHTVQTTWSPPARSGGRSSASAASLGGSTPGAHAGSPSASTTGSSHADAEIRKILCGGTWVKIKINKQPVRPNHARAHRGSPAKAAEWSSLGAPSFPQSQAGIARTML